MKTASRERVERITSALFDRPVIQNNFRSVYVEILVADLLGEGWRHVGADWAAWDLSGPGDLKLEVKQSAALQTWHKSGELRRSRSPSFDIAERTGYYDDDGAWVARPGRFADLYVFAWHPVDGDACDQRDPDQWVFHVLPAAVLPRQKTIALSVVRQLTDEVKASDLGSAVRRASGRLDHRG